MKMKQLRFLLNVAVLIVFAATFLVTGTLWAQKADKPDAVTSATPLALKQAIPDDVYVYVGGRVFNPYRYTGKKLQQFASARVRMTEITLEGKYLGSYIYTGIPVLHLLYKTSPRKMDEDAFDRPLDMRIVFQNKDKKTVSFSYGELTMATDDSPVMLAYHREPLLPSKEPEKYTKNKLPKEFKGLRLICPKDKDNSRCLYDIVDMTIEQPVFPEDLLPKVDKKKECSSKTIICIQGDKQKEAAFDGVPLKKIHHWVRIGHGRGLKGDGPATVEGYMLRSFLEKNFPGCGGDYDFLFIGCDGYRSLLTGKEIFNTTDGESFLIFSSLNGLPTKGGLTLGTIADFFIDRNVWGLSHIVCIKN